MSKRKLQNGSFWHIFICCLILLSFGCKSKKIIQYSGPAPERNKLELIQALEDHNYSYDWYAVETGIRVDNPDEGVSAKAYIRMKKDSIVWSSIKKYNAEGVRTLITENAYATINRQNHTYQRGSTSDALSKMGITLDFVDLQEAIFGNIILLDSSNIETEKEGIHYILTGKDQDLRLIYWLNAYSLELERVQIVDQSGRAIDISYKDYRVLESGQKVAFYRHYKLPYDDRGDAEIVMNVNKIEINVPKKTRFSIPAHYERI